MRVSSAAAFHGCRFDKENVAADRRPRQAGCDAHLIALQQFFLEDLGPAEELIEIVGMDLANLFLADRDLPGNLAADGCDFAFEVPQSGFLRVLIDDGAHAVVGELDLALRQPVLFDLFGNQMPLGDLQLFLFRVAGELDDFHAVAERRLDRIQHVRRRDEHDVRQIERHAEIVVAEREVLFRVEHFEQRG